MDIHKKYQANRVLNLINSIEDKTGLMLHELDRELSEKIKTLEEKQQYSFAIAALTRVLDRVNNNPTFTCKGNKKHILNGN